MQQTRSCAGFVIALVAVVATVACSEADRAPVAPTALGQEVPFSGTVERSEVFGGGHRFSSGPQGVWFRLEEEPDTKYHYFVRSLDDARNDGILEAKEGGELRFADLAGRRLEGVATVRAEHARDVVSLSRTKE